MTTTTLPNPPAKRGDVVLVLFPDSNLRTAKTRPALVVQANRLQTGLSQVILAMITSQMFRAGHPSRVAILLSTTEGQQSGLLTDSVVMTDNLATVIDSAIDRGDLCCRKDRTLQVVSGSTLVSGTPGGDIYYNQ